MVWASIPLSTPFICPNSAVAPPPPASVKFRPPPRISAAYATTTRSRSETSSSLYQVLGIQMVSTCHEIKTAYRRLAKVLHPDVASKGQNDTSSTDEFIRIHTAYSTLSDPQKRADYDQTLIRLQGSMSPSSSSSAVVTASGFSRCTPRTWETDQCW